MANISCTCKKSETLQQHAANTKPGHLNNERAQYFFNYYNFETIIGDTEEKYFWGNKKSSFFIRM